MDAADRAYLKEMAASLRWRRIEEERVVGVLRDLAADATADRSLEQAHGPAADVAEAHGRGNALPPPGLVISSVLQVALVATWIGWNLHRITVGSGPSLLLSLGSSALTLVLLVLCTGLGRTIDGRLPDDLAPAPEG